MESITREREQLSMIGAPSASSAAPKEAAV
jgi:hypothetical protein